MVQSGGTYEVRNCRYTVDSITYYRRIGDISNEITFFLLHDVNEKPTTEKNYYRASIVNHNCELNELWIGQMCSEVWLLQELLIVNYNHGLE